MTASPVLDHHASGYHGASRSAWTGYALDLADTSTVQAWTERYHRFGPALAHAGVSQYVPGAAKGRDNSVEGAITWDRRVWKIIARGTHKVTTKTWHTGKGGERHGVTITWVLLRHRQTGQTLLRLVGHFPASVQNGPRWSRKARRVQAWGAAAVGTRRLIKRLRKRYQPDDTTLSCDYNLDLLRKVWRATVRRITPGRRFTVAVAPLRDGKGSHGDRVIDAHSTTLNRPKARLGRRRPMFDHIAVLLTGRPR